jgi:hypothetical protein
MDLLDRDSVRGRWFSYLNLELGSRRDGFGPATLLQHRDPQRCSFVDGLGGHLDRVPDSRWGREADSSGGPKERPVCTSQISPSSGFFPSWVASADCARRRSRSIRNQDTNASLVSRREAMADAFSPVTQISSRCEPHRPHNLYLIGCR